MIAEQPIVIIKKQANHGGHHGGAWKVAYADFVTAMMSLFIVLWLMNSTSKQTQEEIAGYFNDPKGTASKKGSEGKPIPKEVKEIKEVKEKKDDMAALKLELTHVIQNTALLDKIRNQIEITVTDEGLRVELVEGEKGTFFEVGSPRPTPMLESILAVLASQLKKLPNHLSIEGYTDAQPYLRSAVYGNWELSTDRANEARREMQSNGIRLDQVSQVRGFGDQRLHLPEKPFDAANRRVSLVVQNLPAPVKDKVGPEVPSAGKEPAPAKVVAAPAVPVEQKPTAPASPAKQPGSMLTRVKTMFASAH